MSLVVTSAGFFANTFACLSSAARRTARTTFTMHPYLDAVDIARTYLPSKTETSQKSATQPSAAAILICLEQMNVIKADSTGGGGL